MTLKHWTVLLLFALLATWSAVFTLAPLPEPGAGDPMYYIHASRTLRAGEGLRNFADAPPEAIAVSGEPNGIFATWTPGYPLLLALFENVRIGAWVLNALALALSVMATYGLARDAGLPALLAGGAALLWLFSPPAIHIYRQIMTEGVFVAVSLVWLRTFLRANERGQVLLLSLCSTALFALRYTGAVYVALGAAAVLLAARGDLWQRLERGLAYAFAPILLATWWFTRNWYTLGSLTGHRVPGDYGLIHSTGETLSVILRWMPTILIVTGGLLCVFLLWRRLSSSMRRR